MSKILLLIDVARRSLFVHKLRSFLSVLGVVCGVMAVMSMISTGEGAREEVLQQIEEMGIPISISTGWP
jgi:putative ABC transport system permease protein